MLVLQQQRQRQVDEQMREYLASQKKKLQDHRDRIKTLTEQ